MAIEYIRINVMSRSTGANALEAAAYRSNSKMYDEQLGQTFDYTKKTDCVYANTILPESAFTDEYKNFNHPYQDREKLWNAVELKENGHNRSATARVAFEIQLALPRELDLEMQKKLANEFIYDNYVSKFNIAADVCIHDKGDGNPHAHVMITTRSINGLELSNKKIRNILPSILKSKGLAFSKVDGISKDYAKYQNKFFKDHGINLTVDQSKIHGNIHMRRSRVDKGFYAYDIAKNRDIDQRNLDEVSKDHNIIIDTLAKRQSTFTKADIEMLVLKCTVADNTKSQEVLDKVLSSKRLINLGYSVHGRETFTVKENYRKDIQLLELTSELSGRRGINVHQKLIDQTIAEVPKDYKLTEEQSHSLKHIAHNGNLSCVVGYAGAGKSHSLKYVYELYKKKDIKVYGAAISGKVAQALESDTGMQSSTISSLLMSYGYQSKSLPEKGSVLVIDEAGMVGLDNMVKLMQLAKERDLKLVLVGDPNQLEAIDKGNPFKLISSEIGFATLKDIYRQLDAEDKKATINLAEGRIGNAIDHYNSKGNIHFESFDRIFVSAVDKYLDYVKAGELEQTLALAHTKKDVHQLNIDIRNNLIESNRMSIGNNIDVSIPKGFLQKNETQSRRFAVGEKILFLKNGRVSENEKVKNGLFAVITSIDKGVMSVRTLEGEESSRDLKIDLSNYNSIDYGYATTIHKAQGATVKNTLLFVNSKGWNRNLTYVGMSRHKESLDVYVNNSKYKDLDSLKRGLSSSSNKELNVLDFVRQIDRQGTIPSIKRLFGIESKDYVLSDESKANAKYQDVSQLVDINRDISRSYAALFRNSDDVNAIMKSKYEYRNQLAAKIVGNLDELMPAIHQNKLDVADIHKWAKSNIADKNYKNLGISKELYNDLVIYSKKVLEVSQEDIINFEKIREKNSLAETIYNKHQDEINSNKYIRVGVVKLPEASRRIIDNKANLNDIRRICKGINEAFKSKELERSREREQAMSQSLGIDI